MATVRHNLQLRQAAFDHVNRLAFLKGGVLDAADLAGGFEFGGDRIPLINPQRGIFKPRQIEHLLSIKTVFPRRGVQVWDDDQREAHRQIYAGDDVVEYAFMETDPISPDNRWLRDAMERQIPVVYFLGTLRVTIRLTFRHLSWSGPRITFGSSLRSEHSWGLRLKPCHLMHRNVDMRYGRSTRGCIKHHSETRFSRPMEDDVRSRICLSRDCSTPLTSSWMRTNSLGSLSSQMACP
jgi:hypothetical protein